jgi:hypothetical protein
VLDDAVRAQQPAPEAPPAAPPATAPTDTDEPPNRFAREAGDLPPGGGATPPPDWLS